MCDKVPSAAISEISSVKDSTAAMVISLANKGLPPDRSVRVRVRVRVSVSVRVRVRVRCNDIV
jgi:hypothetical protein